MMVVKLSSDLQLVIKDDLHLLGVGDLPSREPPLKDDNIDKTHNEIK